MESESKDITHIAAGIAKVAHEGQYRLGKEKRPYIVHPALVADLVGKLATQDKEIIAAAWLHDAIEDTPLKSKEDFEAAFRDHGYNDTGSVDRVYRLVQELSNPDGIEWKRIRSFQVDKIDKMTPGAKILKMADQVANTFDVVLYPPVEWPETKIRNYFFKAIDICSACAEAAPKLYSLFSALYQRRSSLSKNDISGLVQQFTQEGGDHQDFGALRAAQAAKPVLMSGSITILCDEDKASGALIDISADPDLADTFRAYIEETGTFSRTLPLKKEGLRELVFAEPVDVSYCRNFSSGEQPALTARGG